MLRICAIHLWNILHICRKFWQTDRPNNQTKLGLEAPSTELIKVDKTEVKDLIRIEFVGMFGKDLITIQPLPAITKQETKEKQLMIKIFCLNDMSFKFADDFSPPPLIFFRFFFRYMHLIILIQYKHPSSYSSIV